MKGRFVFSRDDFILPEAMVVTGTSFLSPDAFREQFKKEYAAGWINTGAADRPITPERKYDSDGRIASYDRIAHPKTPVLNPTGDKLADGNHCMLYCESRGISPIPILVPRGKVDAVKATIQGLDDDNLLDELYANSKAFYEARLAERKRLSDRGNPAGDSLFNAHTSGNSSRMPAQEYAQEIQAFNNLIRVQIDARRFVVYGGEWDLARSPYATAYIEH